MKFTDKRIEEIEILDKRTEEFKYCVYLKEGLINTETETTIWHCNTIKEIKEFLKDVKVAVEEVVVETVKEVIMREYKEHREKKMKEELMGYHFNLYDFDYEMRCLGFYSNIDELIEELEQDFVIYELTSQAKQNYRIDYKIIKRSDEDEILQATEIEVIKIEMI
ncbi:MAG: hypothetical protein ACRC6E_11135 [Fusobacteriaceae bacterium]